MELLQNTIRLLTIVSTSSKDGSTISFLRTIGGLKNLGVEIMVVAPSRGYLTDVLEEKKINYKISPLTNWQKPNIHSFIDVLKFTPKVGRILLREWMGISGVSKIVKEWHPDIIHTNVSVMDIGFKVAKRFKLPHVWHIREYGELDFNIVPLTGRKKRHTKLLSSNVICITKDLKKYNDLGERAKVIYNPLSLNQKKKEISQKKKNFIYVGRLTENKGATEVLNAFVEFSKKNTDYKLEFLGRCEDEKYLNSLKNIVKNNNLDDRVVFAGQVTDVEKRMQNGKAIIVASKHEGFGRITAEAMDNYCLVIGKNTGGTREQFDNGLKFCGKEIGLRYSTPDELYSALEKVAKMTEIEYKEIVEQAAKVVAALYSVKENINETYRYLKSILS